MTDEIELTFTIEETNLVLEALGEQPFSKVFALVEKIQRQASGQVPNAAGGDQGVELAPSAAGEDDDGS